MEPLAEDHPLRPPSPRRVLQVTGYGKLPVLQALGRDPSQGPRPQDLEPEAGSALEGHGSAEGRPVRVPAGCGLQAQDALETPEEELHLPAEAIQVQDRLGGPGRLGQVRQQDGPFGKQEGLVPGSPVLAAGLPPGPDPVTQPGGPASVSRWLGPTSGGYPPGSPTGPSDAGSSPYRRKSGGSSGGPQRCGYTVGGPGPPTGGHWPPQGERRTANGEGSPFPVRCSLLAIRHGEAG